MSTANRDYVDVVYNERDRPLTAYPEKLARYLSARYRIAPGHRLLDMGCGRGEVLRGFVKHGVEGFGVDRSRAAEKYCPEAEIRTADLETDSLPFEDDFFDFVYSKSLLEHFHYPERIVREMLRVLRPGGMAITLCPDWEFNFRIYFEDYTHRTPFMQSSLRDIQLIHGFENVRVERFRQLPVLWGAWSWLLPAAELTRVLTPGFLRSYSKWVRFSKEIMLLSSATKPQTDFRGEPS